MRITSSIFLLLCLGAMEMPKLDERHSNDQKSPKRGRSPVKREHSDHKNNSPLNKKDRSPSPSGRKPSSRDNSPSGPKRIPSLKNQTPIVVEEVPSLKNKSPVVVERVPSLKSGLSLLGSSNQDIKRSPSPPKNRRRPRSPSPQKENQIVRRSSSLRRIKELQDLRNLPQNLFQEPIDPTLPRSKNQKQHSKNPSSKNFFQKTYDQAVNFLGFKKEVSEDKKKILGEKDVSSTADKNKKFSFPKFIAMFSVGILCLSVAFVIAYLVKRRGENNSRGTGIITKRGDFEFGVEANAGSNRRSKRSVDILDSNPANWCRLIHKEGDPPCNGRKKY